MSGVCVKMGKFGELTPEKEPELVELAKQNDAEACYALWWYYTCGPTPRTNVARKWLEKAAQLDHPDALLHMWRMRKDCSNPHARKGGMRYLQRAAELGFAPAQHEMGMVCLIGIACERDEAAAIAWLSKAAEQNHLIAMQNLADYYRNRLSGGDQTAAEPMLSWLRRAAETGSLDAQMTLFDLLRKGKEVPPNLEEAFHWCAKAAEQGDSYSIHNLGVFYLNGTLVEKDEKTAMSYFRQAADLGFAHSQFNLGIAYMQGQGVEQDTATGMELLTQAADQDDLMAIKALCEIYSNGSYGVARDTNRQFLLLMRAVDLGDEESRQMLSSLSEGCEEIITDYFKSRGLENTLGDDFSL